MYRDPLARPIEGQRVPPPARTRYGGVALVDRRRLLCSSADRP